MLSNKSKAYIILAIQIIAAIIANSSLNIGEYWIFLIAMIVIWFPPLIWYYQMKKKEQKLKKLYMLGEIPDE